MKTLKKIALIVLVVILVMSLCAPAFASVIECYTTGKVRMRKGPGLNYSTVKTIHKGAMMECHEVERDERGVLWAHVVGSFTGDDGWVSTTYLHKTRKLPALFLIRATANTYIRQKPDQDSKAIGTLGKSKDATYLQQRAHDKRGVVWYRVSYKGVKGWVSSKNSKIK